MAQLYEPNLTEWLQLSGQNIVQNRPSDEYVPWVLFLLDEMKAFLPPEEYRELLIGLQDELGQRLAQ